MTKTHTIIRIFDEDVVFTGSNGTGTAVMSYKNRDVILQFVMGYPGFVFINGKQFACITAKAKVFEKFLPQVVDEIIGVALGVNFCVKRSENFWHYYAEIEQPWQIESDSYPNTITPSYEHWRKWVIASIEKKGK